MRQKIIHLVMLKQVENQLKQRLKHKTCRILIETIEKILLNLLELSF